MDLPLHRRRSVSTRPEAANAVDEDGAVEQVIQEVHQVEPAAEIPPEEAAEVVEQQWAQSIELLVSGWAAVSPAANAAELWASGVERFMPAAFGLPPGPDERFQGRVLLLEFARHPRELEDAILASEPATAAMGRGVDVRPPWGNGAKVFVANIRAEQLDAPLAGGELRPCHVVIHESDESDLLVSLQHLPHRVRKLKRGVGRAIVPDELALLEVSDEGEHEVADDAAGVIEYSVRGTFLHVAPTLDSTSVRSAP